MQNNSVPTPPLTHRAPTTPPGTYPPGFRFCPTDAELILHYLSKKVSKKPLPCDKIQDVKLYDHNPDTLTEMYKDYGEDNCWYFFTPRDKKYPNGQRPDRGTKDGVGYWKATGADKKIKSEGTLIGKKKSLVFFEGGRNQNLKTSWLMHEYELPKEGSSSQVKNNTTASEGNDMQLDHSVLCKVYKKLGQPAKRHPMNDARNETALEEVEQHVVQQSDFQGLENSKQPQQQDVNYNQFGFPMDQCHNQDSYIHQQKEPGLGYSDNQIYDFGEELEAQFADPEAQCYSLQQLPEFCDQPAFKNEDHYTLPPPPESISQLVDDHPGTKNYSNEHFSGHGCGAPQYSGYGCVRAPQSVDHGHGFFDSPKFNSVYQGQTIQTANVPIHSISARGFISPPKHLD